MGLVFHRPGSFRDGWGFAVFGSAIAFDDLEETGDAAESELTARIDAALRDLIVEARDRETMRLVEDAESVTFGPAELETLSPTDLAEWRKRAIHAGARCLAADPRRLERVERDLVAYANSLASLGLDSATIPRKYTWQRVAGYAVREGATLLIGLPLALLGLLSHAIPFAMTWTAERLARPDPSTEATVKIASGVVLYPMGWGLLGWAIWRRFGPIAAALFLASLVPSGFFALAWRDRLRRFRRDARGFFNFLLRRDLHAALIARRTVLRAEIAALLETWGQVTDPPRP